MVFVTKKHIHQYFSVTCGLNKIAMTNKILNQLHGLSNMLSTKDSGYVSCKLPITAAISSEWNSLDFQGYELSVNI